jgi:phosphoribosylanthranilate isomerase
MQQFRQLSDGIAEVFRKPRRPIESAPKDATRPGGLGTPFDWHLLENLRLAVPFMVSGGIKAANVAEALRITRAAGVDVSSWVESAPGVKDIAMIRAFVAAARSAEVAPAPSALARSLKRQGP